MDDITPPSSEKSSPSKVNLLSLIPLIALISGVDPAEGRKVSGDEKARRRFAASSASIPAAFPVLVDIGGSRRSGGVGCLGIAKPDPIASAGDINSDVESRLRAPPNRPMFCIGARKGEGSGGPEVEADDVIEVAAVLGCELRVEG